MGRAVLSEYRLVYYGALLLLLFYYSTSLWNYFSLSRYFFCFCHWIFSFFCCCRAFFLTLSRSMCVCVCAMVVWYMPKHCFAACIYLKFISFYPSSSRFKYFDIHFLWASLQFTRHEMYKNLPFPCFAYLSVLTFDRMDTHTHTHT